MKNISTRAEVVSNKHQMYSIFQWDISGNLDIACA
jgi:hypothetical protein